MFFPDVMLHLVERLQPRGFIFSADAEVSAHELSSQLESARKEARKVAAVGRFLLRRLYRVPAAGNLAASLIDFELELDELDELEGLSRRMRRTFDLNGLHLTAKGLQYFACLDCDDLDAGELAAKADAFQELAAALRAVTSRLRVKVLGKALGKGQEMHVYGSLCLVCGNPRELERLAAEIDRLEFQGTGLGHRLISNLKLNDSPSGSSTSGANE